MEGLYTAHGREGMRRTGSACPAAYPRHNGCDKLDRMELLFLTELLGLRVHDVKGRAIGRLKDAALVPMVHQSRVDRYLVGTGATWLTVRADQVGEIGLGGVYLRDEQLTPYHNDESVLRIVRDLL